MSRAGPFLWDPARADPNKVGGVTGSGYNTTNVAHGGNTWGRWAGAMDKAPMLGAMLIVLPLIGTGNLKDVVYLTSDLHSSVSRPCIATSWGMYGMVSRTFGEKNGTSSNAIGFKSSATIDSAHNLYIRTGTVAGRYTSGLIVSDLDNANAAQLGSNFDIGINLINSDGTDFRITGDYGIDYDIANNRVIRWDGNKSGGTVWSAKVVTDAAGNVDSSTFWAVIEIPSSILDHPKNGNFATNALGKWYYEDALGNASACIKLPRSAGEVGPYRCGFLYSECIAITRLIASPVQDRRKSFISSNTEALTR